MGFGVESMQTHKTLLHGFQGVLIFVSWAVCIAVLRKAGIDGRIGWYFGLCFLSIIPIIYLTMTPRFERTKKFAHPYVIAVVDIVFTILWLSAFASVAAFNTAGSCKKACSLSKVVVAFGVFITLLWAAASAMSVYGVQYYRRNGSLPGMPSRGAYDANAIDPDKEAFSTAPHDEEYAPVHHNDMHDRPESDHFDADDFHTGYNNTNAYAPAGESSTAYTGAQGSRVHFPDANYN